MAVRSGPDGVSTFLRQKGYWEISAASQITSGLGGNVTLPAAGSGTFLDVGGNMGYFSLLFAHRGDSVITVEPMPANRAAIEATLCLNPDLRDRVTVVPMAIGSAAELGRSCVVRPQWHRNPQDGVVHCGEGLTCRSNATAEQLKAHKGMVKTHDEWHALPCEAVSMTTIDVLLDRLKPASIDAVKMDVEGHECNVLESAASLFRIYRPTVVVAELP